MNVQSILDKANAEAIKLQSQMNQIVEREGGGAPEYMNRESYDAWCQLWKLNKSIQDRIMTVQRAAASLDHYLIMEVI